jgi:hypothetical protein
MKVARLLVLGLVVSSFGSVANAQQLTEGFDAAGIPATWLVRNQSAAIGSNVACWNALGASPWLPQAGTGHAGANFNCTSGANEISGWLITPDLTNLQNGQQVSFWTRTGTPENFADRLQVRLCLAAICGDPGSTGTLSGDVGLYTTLLNDINPTLVLGVYPTVFTQFTSTLSGLPAGPNTGRIAWRYFVTNGGPLGANSNVISIDTVNVTPVELQEFSVD